MSKRTPPKPSARPPGPKPPTKLPTGIKGLDEVLMGGLPLERTTVIAGGPGCGKTVIGLNLAANLCTRGQSALVVTFEETVAAMRANALALGWDFPSWEKQGRLALIDGSLPEPALSCGDFDLGGLLAIVAGQAREMKARLVVLDSLDALLRVLDRPARERRELNLLYRWLQEQGLTALVTLKHGAEEAAHLPLDYLADCLIQLDQRVSNQISTRRLRVIKCRGSAVGYNEYPFVINPGGIKLMAITSTRLERGPVRQLVSSGHPEMDHILGGGLRRGSSILLSGETGTGKTTLASIFSIGVCSHGQRLLYVSFEEAAEAIIQEMESPGLKLAPQVKSGHLRYLTLMPESRGAEEHLIEIMGVVEQFQPQHLVVDAISAFMRLGGEHAGFSFTTRLLNTLKQQGITCLLLNQIEGLENIHMISGMAISTLLDTVLFTRYRDIGGELNRMLLVLKSRGMKHSNQYREFHITDQGIVFAPVYQGTGGVLTGAARQEQEIKEEAERRRLNAAIMLHERELVGKRLEMEYRVKMLQSELELSQAKLEAQRLERELWEVSRRQRGNLRNEKPRANIPGKK